MSKSNKTKFRALIIIVLVIVAVVIALLVFHMHSNLHEADSKEEILDSGVIIRPVESDDSNEEEQNVNHAPDDDSKTEASQSETEEQGTIVLENQGDLEIIIPEGMDSDGL